MMNNGNLFLMIFKKGSVITNLIKFNEHNSVDNFIRRNELNNCAYSLFDSNWILIEKGKINHNYRRVKDKMIKVYGCY